MRSSKSAVEMFDTNVNEILVNPKIIELWHASSHKKACCEKGESCLNFGVVLEFLCAEQEQVLGIITKYAYTALLQKIAKATPEEILINTYAHHKLGPHYTSNPMSYALLVQGYTKIANLQEPDFCTALALLEVMPDKAFDEYCLFPGAPHRLPEVNYILSAAVALGMPTVTIQKIIDKTFNPDAFDEALRIESKRSGTRLRDIRSRINKKRARQSELRRQYSAAALPTFRDGGDHTAPPRRAVSLA